MMLRLCALLMSMLAANTGLEVNHIPSIVYGQILVGPGSSRYETIFLISSRKEELVHLELFTEDGTPLRASFLDSDGTVAWTDSSFRFYVSPHRALKIKLQLSPEEMNQDVALKTGWANFSSAGGVEVSTLVRVLNIDGTLIDKHLLSSQKPPRS